MKIRFLSFFIIFNFTLSASLVSSYVLFQEDGISFYEDGNDNQSKEESESKEEVKISKEIINDNDLNSLINNQIETKVFEVYNIKKSRLYLEIDSPPPK